MSITFTAFVRSVITRARAARRLHGLAAFVLQCSIGMLGACDPQGARATRDCACRNHVIRRSPHIMPSTESHPPADTAARAGLVLPPDLPAVLSLVAGAASLIRHFQSEPGLFSTRSATPPAWPDSPRKAISAVRSTSMYPWFAPRLALPVLVSLSLHACMHRTAFSIAVHCDVLSILSRFDLSPCPNSLAAATQHHRVDSEAGVHEEVRQQLPRDSCVVRPCE